MNFTIIVSSAIVSAVISAAGAVISSVMAKKAAEKTAKISAESEINKLKLEFSQSDKIRSEESDEARRKEKERRYAEMIRSVVEYRDKNDINYKTAAESSIRLVIALGYRDPNILALQKVVSESDPFEGPQKDRLNKILDQISIDLCK